MCVEGEGIKDHGANESDVCGLAVVDSFPSIDPKTSKLRKYIYCLECLEVIDENIGNPEVLDKLQVYWKVSHTWLFLMNSVKN